MKTERYGSLVFDCDGVVLNSNKVKTKAFYEAALPYGEGPAQALVDHHVANGGVSRYRKFEHFLNQIVPSDAVGPGLDELLDVYARKVREGLIECEADSGLFELREQTQSTSWSIVSGGDQAELRKVFSVRGLDQLFDGGIYGSPDTKDEILARELRAGRIVRPALFIGDSRYDHEASVNAGLDFVFVNQWTEFSGWKSYCDMHNVEFVASLRDLV
ncbi:HAD hydrolase-like protein [Marinobacter salinisoli]|uniref:HAD hydrolase-like protein n=1 Tax=Marinobacter salinisoli TaxID=2769486 RepID=A0ABX7MQQ6_9GAMM|nr:HAD hydrolase-like protein [Marinobacter salinisoli]QSP94474.1 HAD hydrolase-like protein [Marinobacter salinisoli]